MTEQQNSIEIYQTDDGQTQVDVHFEQETVWPSLQTYLDVLNR